MLPPLPPWDGMHPQVIHFPIALLLVAPIFILLGLALPRLRALPLSALILMALGTAGAFLATATGEAAADNLSLAGAADAALEHHEELGELTRNLFAGLTIAFAALLGAPLVLKARWPRMATTIGQVVLLVAYLGACGVLANAAHAGGRLVHEFGIHARLTDTAPPPRFPEQRETDESR